MVLKGAGKFLLTALLLLPVLAPAQIDDTGLWLGITAEKKLTRKVSVFLGEQIRFQHDISDVSSALTDAGIEYAFTKKIKAGFHYRFINSNQDNYYSKRHRLYLDLSYKQKVSFVSLILRERFQEQYSDLNSSENGKIPVWFIRSKLTAKFDVEKKYVPYVSTEFYYLLDNVKEQDNYFSRIRYEAGISYDFNRIHNINPFVLFQHSRPDGFNELVYGITYNLTF